MTPVQVGNGDDLSSDIVVDPVDGVGVDETVPHPQTSPHCLFHLTYHLGEEGGGAEEKRERRKNL